MNKLHNPLSPASRSPRPQQRIIGLLLAGASVASVGIVGCTPVVEVQADRGRLLSQTDTVASRTALADVQALVKLGPRVTGTPVMEQARAYLIEQYTRAGYETRTQTFTYPKFEDLGSHITVNGQILNGRALNGSTAGKPSARLVVVPNVGQRSDFATVDVRGVIALVRRGEIPFLQKAQNAVEAGAVGVVIVNNEPGELYGTLGDEVQIPVLALSGKAGNSLFESQRSHATLAVNTRQRTVMGTNVIAHLPDVTQPRVVVGAHYDSVPGSPGANDNASGTAVVLDIARNVAQTPLAREAWFVAFDGEEDGLHGSRAFVSQAQPDWLQSLDAMLNFDMVGVNEQLLVGGTQSLTKLVQATQSDISTFGGQGGSDHAPFARVGVPVLFFYRGQEPNYHTPNDKSVDPRLLDETTQVGLNVLKQLLGSDTNNRISLRKSLL
ncbi:M28 family peptidase [Chroococcidiopsis sp. TS-821]|uniref:M28 family peptidase n=1 Tax=Chroococcidiopsis sp. TS-821 TaxID=1378066 RepID=UPI000D4B7B8A|nr:M28 family peptidase [Chroococcidiopsis sp. TS-821]PPS43430.1 aminopeptidase [Chroococcidiopsis sp. TS-821]